MTEIKAQLNKEEAIKLLNEDLDHYYKLNTEIKKLNKELADLKTEVLSLVESYSDDKNFYKNDKYYAKITRTDRPYLRKELVEKYLNVIVTNECYIVTPCCSLRIDVLDRYKEPRLLIENNKQQPIEIGFNIEL